MLRRRRKVTFMESLTAGAKVLDKACSHGSRCVFEAIARGCREEPPASSHPQQP